MRPLRLMTATSLIAMATLLGGCDFAVFTSSQSSAQGVAGDDATRTVDRVFEAVARGDAEEAARAFAANLPDGASGQTIVQSLRDGPLRMVESVLWTARSAQTGIIGTQTASIEGIARLVNGDEIPVRAQLTLIDGHWNVVSLAATGQQRASASRRVLTSSTTTETPPAQRVSTLPAPVASPPAAPAATPNGPNTERIATQGSGTVTSAPMPMPQPPQPGGNIRLAQAPAPQPVPGQAVEPALPPQPAPVQPRIVQTPQPPAAEPQPVPGQLPVGTPPPMPPGVPTAIPTPQPGQPGLAAPAPQPPAAAPPVRQQRSGGAPLPPPVQASDIPDEATRIALVQETMHLIVGSLASNDYSTLHGNSSRFFQQTHNVRELERAIRIAFSGLRVDQNTLANVQPKLAGQPFLHQDGMWRQQGYYDFGQRRVAFRFAFTAEDGVWKLGRFILQQGGPLPQGR